MNVQIYEEEEEEAVRNMKMVERTKKNKRK